MSEELEEQYEEEGYAEQGDKGYFRKDGPKIDKTMLLAWGISVASATVILLIATLIVIAVMEEEEEPIEYAIAPATMMEEQVEQQQEVKRKQLEKQASSSSINTPIVAQALSEIAMETVDFKVDTGDSESVNVGVVGTAMNMDMGDMGGMNLNIKMPKIMGSRCDKADRLRRLKREGGKESTEEAVVKGLNWLKNVQNDDGSWGFSVQTSYDWIIVASLPWPL